MESVSRASDTERSAWSHTYSATAEPVKEEPEWGDGVTEAAAAEGLYAGHDVKDELVLGPELIQIQDVALPMTCPLNGAKEDPCKLEPGDGARAAAAGPPTSPGEGPRCSTSHQQHIKPKRCSVRLERFPIEHIPTCNNCLIIFHSKSSLKNHSCTNLLKSNFDNETAKFKKPNLTSHTGEAGNLSIRDIKLAHNSTLTELTPAHTAEKAYSCFMCRKKFAQPWHLKSHMRVHTAKKPFYCNVCKKKFVLKDKLVKHRRVHEDEKIFSCDLCKKKFRTKPRLVIHMSTDNIILVQMHNPIQEIGT